MTSSAIASLIQKYSNSSEYITDSQFQTFMDKIHNCDRCNGSTQLKEFRCLSAEEIFQLVNIKNRILDISGFIQLCPVLLESMETDNCSADNLSWNILLEKNYGKPTSGEVWCYGVLFVTVISLCSLIGVFVVPLMKKEFYNQLLVTLVGLAVGSLTSSAIFHLIPQSYGIVDSDDEHGYLCQSFMMVAGIWVFFLAERILNCISIFRSKKCHKLSSYKDSTFNVLPTSDPTADQSFLDNEKESPKEQKHGHAHVIDNGSKMDNSIATIAWMVIFGDGFHNFIDGLSIGAAFNENLLTGISISLAVFCEELPHELGDIAVLLNSGMEMKQALLYNFLSACTCYLGLILGILSGKVHASTYVFGFAAGMFLYIALVDMVPKMNEMAEEAGHTSIKKAVHTLFLQNLGIAIGVFSLFALAKYQSYFDFS